MRNVLEALIAARNAGKKVIYTALVETRGSTPQKAGAIMLVYEDGSQVGTLGGGCVEAEVKRRSLENLTTGHTEIAVFQLDHDYGWDDGLICGGRMTLLIAPVRESDSVDYYEELLHRIRTGEGFTEAIFLDESSGLQGTRFLFSASGEVVRSHPEGVHPPQVLLENLKALPSRPRAYVTGGVSYLPHLPLVKLVIVGAGHVGRKLAEYAADVDFEVTVVDDREEFCNPENIPQAKMWINGDFAEVLPQFEIDSQTFCVIVTRGHHHDEEALFHLIARHPRYLGMIGSRRKIRLIFEDLLRNGIAQELLDQVHAPIGLEIGSQTVPEIAISIVAQLIEQRQGEGKGNTPAATTAEACE